MSGDWAWKEAVGLYSQLHFCYILIIFLKDKIAVDHQTHGAMLVPIILGSNKTTVLVAMSHNEYYPLYLSIGNVHNNIHQAHCGTVAVITFLSILKGSSISLHQWVLIGR
jgi:Plavaka transposase